MAKKDNPFDNKTGIHEETGNSDILLVCFSGALAKDNPTFQFYSALKNVRCDKIFLRDFHDFTFLKGIDDEYDSYDKLRARLKRSINKYPYKRIVFMGSSMGAFGAIMLADSLNVDAVLAFSPLTYYTKFRRALFRETRWQEKIVRLHRSDIPKIKWDLKHYMKKHSAFETKVFIFYSKLMKDDTRHAKYLSSFNNVSLVPVEEGGHNLVRLFVRRGILVDIVENALSGDYGYFNTIR